MGPKTSHPAVVGAGGGGGLEPAKSAVIDTWAQGAWGRLKGGWHVEEPGKQMQGSAEGLARNAQTFGGGVFTFYFFRGG